MRVKLPPTIKRKKVWDHQIEAVQYGLLKERGAMFAMDMGTGKLLSSLLLAYNRKAKLVLVVAPKRAVDEWQIQIEQWWKWEPAHVFVASHGTVARSTAAMQEFVMGRWQQDGTIFVLTNYERVWRDPFYRVARNTRWSMVIADECHRLRSPGGKASSAMHRIRAQVPFVLGTTGTPFPSSPINIYAQARAIDDTVFGTQHKSFMNTYAVMGGFENREVVAIRNKARMVRNFYSMAYRVTDDNQNLPAVRTVRVSVTLDPKTMKKYKELEKEFVTEIDGHEISADNTLVRLLRLQQITSGYIAGDPPVRIGTEKSERLFDLLDGIGESECVVVFANFHYDLDEIRRVTKLLGRSYGEISGRHSDYLAWRRGEKRLQVIGVQYQAGSESINLTACRYGVMYNLPLSLDQFKQARKRLHRPGQTRKVVLFHLLADRTADIKIRRGLMRSEDLVQTVQNDYGRTGQTLMGT